MCEHLPNGPASWPGSPPSLNTWPEAIAAVRPRRVGASTTPHRRPAGPEETAAETARLLDEHIHGAHTDATSVAFEPELVGGRVGMTHDQVWHRMRQGM
jgi:hypothetical protein